MSVATAEKFADTHESYRREGLPRALGRLSIEHSELGINDPLTHLAQYLEFGEDAIAAIEEDLITDIAERKQNTKFINSVKFDRVDSDFMSKENKFSMRQMTSITETKFSTGNIYDMRLYERAKIESKEVARLDHWFENAQVGDVFIVESMGLTDKEKYTIVRVYEKANTAELIEHVIPLHNATVDVFNQLHKSISADVPNSESELELLDHMYAHHPKGDDFIGKYVDAYDKILAVQNGGQEHQFGLQKTGERDEEDDMEAIRRQVPLRSIYLKSVRALADCGGRVTPEILRINRDLDAKLQLVEGEEISSVVAREILDRSLQSIVATLNRAPRETLEMLASGDLGSAYGSAGYYGAEARSEGVRYEGACPSSTNAAASEAEAMANSHHSNKNNDPAQCGTCPKCKKQYFVPDDLYKKMRIVHCNGCNSAIAFGGAKLDWEAINKYYGKDQDKPKQLGFVEMISLSLQKYDAQDKIEKLNQRIANTGSKFEKRRSQQLLAEEYARLEAIKKLVG